MPSSKYHRVYKFENGATLIYFKHNVNNTTKILSGFISGAQKDIIPGTAHYLEHMMSNLGRRQNFARKYNIITNACTTHSYVAFDLNIPNQYIDYGINLLQYMTFNSKFNAKEFENERNAILQEKLIYTNEHFNIDDLYYKSFTKQGLLGSEEDIKKIIIDDLYKYQKENFVSENLVICVTSSLDFETIKQKIEKNIVSNVKSDITKKNEPYKDVKLNEKSYFVYEPEPNVKTVSITFGLVDKMSLETSSVYSYVDDFVFNDDFSGLLIKKLRTEKGLVYSAGMSTTCGANNDTYRVFYITTSKEHVNEAIEALGEVLETARNGLTQKQYQDYKTKLKAIETDRRNDHKYLDPSVIFYRYITGQKLWFNNPVHKAIELPLDQINNYLSKTFKNKPVYFEVIGDIDLSQIYDPISIQEITKTKKLKYIMEKDEQGNIYYSSDTGEQVDAKEAETKHTGFVEIVDTPKQDVSLTEFVVSLMMYSKDQKLNALENIAKVVGIQDLEKELKIHNAKKRLLVAFAKNLNIDLNLEQGIVKELTQNVEADEDIQKLRELPLIERLKLIKQYAEKIGYDFEFYMSNKEKVEQKEDEQQK